MVPVQVRVAEARDDELSDDADGDVPDDPRKKRWVRARYNLSQHHQLQIHHFQQ